ncbi:MAG: DUF4129 domain-containing protein [Bergeyella sp.]
MKIKPFVFFVFLLSSGIYAQDVPPPPVTIEADSLWKEEGDYYENMLPVDSLLRENRETSNTTYPKTFDANFREKYKGEEFNYTIVKPKESLWAKIERRIKKIIESIFGEMAPLKATEITNTILKFLAIIIAGTALYFLLRFLLNKEGNFFFGKKNKKLDIRSGDLHENIHEINFPESILQFERQKDFRSAIRYHFLFLLKKLSDKKAIEWNPEKTNLDYFYELKEEKLKARYKKLAYIFDNVWYGEFDLSETEYHQFRKEFEQPEL